MGVVYNECVDSDICHTVSFKTWRSIFTWYVNLLEYIFFLCFVMAIVLLETFGSGICGPARNMGRECLSCIVELRKRFFLFLHSGMCVSCQRILFNDEHKVVAFNRSYFRKF